LRLTSLPKEWPARRIVIVLDEPCRSGFLQWIGLLAPFGAAAGVPDMLVHMCNTTVYGDHLIPRNGPIPEPEILMGRLRSARSECKDGTFRPKWTGEVACCRVVRCLGMGYPAWTTGTPKPQSPLGLEGEQQALRKFRRITKRQQHLSWHFRCRMH